MGKVSFTHLIGYAIVRAIADAVPAMSNTFVEGADGKPRLVRNDTSTWASPSTSTRATAAARSSCRSSATPTTLDFAGFLAAYEELIRKVKAQQAAPSSDFQGATVTLTNPGTIGTVQSVPRLMPGQGVIVGVGSHRLPGRVRGRRPSQPRLARRSARSSRSPAPTTTASSRAPRAGLFLKRVHELLLGEHGFYDDVFHAPRHAVRGGASGAPTSTRSTAKRRCCRSRCRSPR